VLTPVELVLKGGEAQKNRCVALWSLNLACKCQRRPRMAALAPSILVAYVTYFNLLPPPPVRGTCVSVVQRSVVGIICTILTACQYL